MTNRYFTNTIDLIGGTKARASDVEANFTQVGNGFDGVQTDMDAKAPLSNPSLTGVPTAPTAALGTSSTQLATTEFVASQAFASSLPGQAGNAGKHLTTNGAAASWQTIAATWGNISGQPVTILGYTGQTAAAARTELGGVPTLAGAETLTNKTLNGANNTFSNIPTSALTGAVAIANGGTAAATASGARSNLDVPSTSGAGANGTWSININGVASTAANANACSGNSATATKAGSLGSGGAGGGAMYFTYSGNGGTPLWVWGSNTGDGSSCLVWNPANFNVNYAATAGYASSAGGTIGVSQSWQDVTGSRAANTSYYNTTGRPIMVSVICTGPDGGPVLYINNIRIASTGNPGGTTGNDHNTVCGIVPNGSGYYINMLAQSVAQWLELR